MICIKILLISDRLAYISKKTGRITKSIMCLGIPMQVVELGELSARCVAKDIFRDVSLFMMQEEVINKGDYLVIHGGYAIQKVTEEEARAAWEIYDLMLAADAG